MKNIKDVLLKAVSALPARHYIMQIIKGQAMLSLTQKVIAAIYKIAEEENGYAAEQPVLIEKIMDIAELHSELPEDTFRAIRSRLNNMPSLLEKLGIKFTMQPGDWGLCEVRNIHNG